MRSRIEGNKNHEAASRFIRQLIHELIAPFRLLAREKLVERQLALLGGFVDDLDGLKRIGDGFVTGKRQMAISGVMLIIFAISSACITISCYKRYGNGTV